MGTHEVVAGHVSAEVAAFVAALATSRGITRSQAVAIILSKAAGLGEPSVRKPGRPRKRDGAAAK